MAQYEIAPCEHDWIAMAAGDMPNHAGWELRACCRRCGLTALIPLPYGLIYCFPMGGQTQDAEHG